MSEQRGRRQEQHASSTEVLPSSKSSNEQHSNKSQSSNKNNQPPDEITTTSSKNKKTVSTPLTVTAGKNLVQFVETSTDHFVPFKRLSKPEVSIDTLIDDLSQKELANVCSKIKNTKKYMEEKV